MTVKITGLSTLFRQDLKSKARQMVEARKLVLASVTNCVPIKGASAQVAKASERSPTDISQKFRIKG